MVDIHDVILPPDCWRKQIRQDAGDVVHYVSVNPHHASIIPGAVEDPYHPITVMQFLHEFNAPGNRRGRIMEREPGASRQWASYHIVIGRGPDHGVYRFVPEKYQAYHAGVSEWPSRELSDLNWHTRGIALTGGAGVEFTDWQYEQLIAIAVQSGRRFVDMVGPDFVARPKGRRSDPGPLFDWQRVREGIGR